MSGLSTERTNVGVVGGGAWGTALAVHCARMGHQVLLWALEPEASPTPACSSSSSCAGSHNVMPSWGMLPQAMLMLSLVALAF